MSTVVSVVSVLVNVLVFNYMFILGELPQNYDSEEVYVAFANLYGPMIKTPFFGNYYPYITTIAMLLLSATFFIL